MVFLLVDLELLFRIFFKKNYNNSYNKYYTITFVDLVTDLDIILELNYLEEQNLEFYVKKVF